MALRSLRQLRYRNDTSTHQPHSNDMQLDKTFDTQFTVEKKEVKLTFFEYANNSSESLGSSHFQLLIQHSQSLDFDFHHLRNIKKRRTRIIEFFLDIINIKFRLVDTSAFVRCITCRKKAKNIFREMATNKILSST